MRLLLRAIAIALLLPASAPAQTGTPASAGVAAAQAGATLVVLVRHAEKAAEPAGDPPLTPAGQARAEALARVLADARIDVVITTPYARTRATAAPVEARGGTTHEEMSPAGGVPAHAAAIAARIRTGLAGRRVLVVGHSNTIPAIIRALGGPAMSDLCDGQHAFLFVLNIPAAGPASLVRASYGAPDAADAETCAPMRP